MRQRPAQVLAQARTDVVRERPRFPESARKRVLVGGQPECFELRRTARRILAHQHEVARVRHQHQPVAPPIAAHLVASRREPSVVSGGLHLDHTALRHLPLPRPAFLHLRRPVEPEIGMTRAVVGELAHTKHLWRERHADGVQQVRERPIARSFPGCPTRCAHPSEITEVGLNRRSQCRVRSRHRSRRAFSSSGTIRRVSMKWYRADRETSRILAMEAFETPFPRSPRMSGSLPSSLEGPQGSLGSAEPCPLGLGGGEAFLGPF